MVHLQHLNVKDHQESSNILDLNVKDHQESSNILDFILQILQSSSLDILTLSRGGGIFQPPPSFVSIELRYCRVIKDYCWIF